MDLSKSSAMIIDKLEEEEKKVNEDHQNYLKKFLYLRRCLGILDDIDYIEISVLCEELMRVAKILAKWEGHKEYRLNRIKEQDYSDFLNNYQR